MYKRQETETTPETITSYSYDAAGRTIATRRDIGAMTTVESTEYDDLGRVISSTDVLGRVTRTEYSEDGLTTTVTTPAGATLITKKYYDGIDLFHGGTGQRGIETQLELTEEGILTTTLSKGVILSRNLKNGFGQITRQEQPNTKGSFIVIRELAGKPELVLPGHISFFRDRTSEGSILVAGLLFLLTVEDGSDVLQGIVHEVEMLFYFHSVFLPACHHQDCLLYTSPSPRD